MMEFHYFQLTGLFDLYFNGKYLCSVTLQHRRELEDAKTAEEQISVLRIYMPDL